MARQEALNAARVMVESRRLLARFSVFFFFPL